MAATFKPYSPWGTPPADRYDPYLDAQLAAGQRGLGDYVTDASTSNRRATEDYGFGVHDAQLGQTRGQQDIATQRGYATQDHQRAIDMLTRQYTQLGSAQGQQANVMGVAGGGALLQAARKRAANETIDQQPIDTGFHRQTAALDTQGQRLNEDTGTSIARLGVNTERQVGDTNLGVQRAGREQIFLGGDTTAAKSAQAAQSGWDPGAKPKNEFTGGPYGAHQVIVRGKTAYGVDPSGKVLFQRAARR